MEISEITEEEARRVVVGVLASAEHELGLKIPKRWAKDRATPQAMRDAEDRRKWRCAEIKGAIGFFKGCGNNLGWMTAGLGLDVESVREHLGSKLRLAKQRVAQYERQAREDRPGEAFSSGEAPGSLPGSQESASEIRGDSSPPGEGV